MNPIPMAQVTPHQQAMVESNNPSETTSGKRKLESSKENTVNGRQNLNHAYPTGRQPAVRYHHSYHRTPYANYRRYPTVVGGYSRVYHPRDVSSTQNSHGCRGCLCGSSPVHLKLLHSVMTQAIYSSDDCALARQQPGSAFCHDGLVFRFERNTTGKSMVVVRSDGCTGVSWCRACQEQMERVASMLRHVSAEHSGDPEEICKVTPLERIKFVPSLAGAQLQKMKAELEDYKENGITIVRV
jgi:hypothetical protein